MQSAFHKDHKTQSTLFNLPMLSQKDLHLWTKQKKNNRRALTRNMMAGFMAIALLPVWTPTVLMADSFDEAH